MPKRDQNMPSSLTTREMVRHSEETESKVMKSEDSVIYLGGDMISKNNFKLVYVIGKGGFGKVWKVEMKKNSRIYAMKEMYKSKIINKKSINSVMNERTLLAKLKHPFLVNMVFAFQDRDNLYLVMDFLNGGDLRYHIGVRRRFTQNQTRFFVACIIIGLQYLHTNKVIHRDIKPENLVLESNGYVRITDLGVSREWREDNATDTSGTPGYMAPEVICRKNHSYAADYFALGVMAYEFMLGKRPYLGKNRKEIRDQILAKQVALKIEDLPNGWSPESADFINKLLIRNPHYRLGANGADEVKQHAWLRNIDWAKLSRKEIRAPYIPMNIEDNYDDYKNQISEDTIIENAEENGLLLRDREVQSLFEGYYFDSQKPAKKTSIKSTMYTTNPSIPTDCQGNYKMYLQSKIK